MIPAHLRVPLALGAGGVGILVLTGLLLDRGGPTTRTETRTRTENAMETESRTDSQAREAITELVRQNQELQARLATQERRQADTQVRTVERIERYLPSPSLLAPASSAAPAAPSVVVVRDQEPGLPDPQPVSVPRDPVEIITRTIEAIDRTRSESSSEGSSSSKSTTAADTTRTTDTSTTATARTETTETTDTTAKTEGRPAGGSGDGGRIGIGVTSAAAPFVSYDLARVSLGPKSFGLGRIGAGLFVTRPLSGGDFDGGPQVNIQPGRRRLFIMGGYQVRRQTPVIGVGVKF